MPRLRQNILTGEWVVIAPGRSKRPQDFVQKEAPKKKVKKECPFCVDNNIAYKTQIEKAETKNVYVIPNLYPAFVQEDDVIVREDEYYPSYKSLGGHEVIILKDHNKEMGELSKPVLEEYFHVYQQRLKHYRDNPTIEYPMIIHNYGARAGASIEHPHSQLFASSIMPPVIEKEVENSRKFYQEEKKCPLCWIVKEEQEKKVRIISQNQYFIAFTFWAARFPFEIWIVPKKHQTNFEDINRSQRLAMAETYLEVMNKLNSSLKIPPYNYFIHSLPPRYENKPDMEKYYHWHLEITPRLSVFGGYELGSGIVIDVVSPEKAAMFLNQKGTEIGDETLG